MIYNSLYFININNILHTYHFFILLEVCKCIYYFLYYWNAHKFKEKARHVVIIVGINKNKLDETFCLKTNLLSCKLDL